MRTKVCALCSLVKVRAMNSLNWVNAILQSGVWTTDYWNFCCSPIDAGIPTRNLEPCDGPSHFPCRHVPDEKYTPKNNKNSPHNKISVPFCFTLSRVWNSPRNNSPQFSAWNRPYWAIARQKSLSAISCLSYRTPALPRKSACMGKASLVRLLNTEVFAPSGNYTWMGLHYGRRWEQF